MNHSGQNQRQKDQHGHNQDAGRGRRGRRVGTSARLRALCAMTLTLSAAALAAGGCIDNSGLLIILQNQMPSVVDVASHNCQPGSTASASPVGSGVLDLEIGTNPPPLYMAYPLVQSTLPPRATSPGATEPNTVYVDGVRGVLVPPPGLTITWPVDCPASFSWPSTAALLPGTTLGLSAQVIRPCQAAAIHALFASGELPSDFSQQVLFTVEMRVVGRVTSGSEITSDAFRFAVRVCVGCLQTGFADMAQFNFPARPSCSVAPKPNPYHGNPCNLSQDTGPLLCCTGDMNQPVCPAPDM